MLFQQFSKFLQQLETTPSRNQMTVLMSELFDQLEEKEVPVAMYLMQGRLVPKYIALEFNFSRKLALRALTDLIENNGGNSKVKELFSELGDVGLVAEILIKDKKEGKNEALQFDLEVEEKKDLNILEVYEKLKNIAESEGKGSQEEKLQQYANLLRRLDPLSARYVTRIIIGELRLGLSDKTILDSLSWYAVGDKSIRGLIDAAFGARADLGELAQIIIKAKRENSVEKALKNITVEVGTPIASKLVEREANSEKVWKRMPNCFVQPKLDGLRGQIHFSKIKADSLQFTPQAELTAIFSRNMEDMTEQFPELVEAVKKLDVESIILDSEILGYDNTKELYLTYQETMQRKRKYDISNFVRDIPVKAFCFDILYFNGEDLTSKPLEERLSLLRKVLQEGSVGEARLQNNLVMLETKQVTSEDELESYFKKQVEDNHLEGIITKEAGSIYEPGTRNFKWIKLKANTRSDLVDTIDVVVMGYYSGKGSRAKFKVGTLLTGVYNPADDKFYSIGKVGSGFSEEDLKQIYEDLQKIRVEEKPDIYEVEKPLLPDVWVEPKIIMEVTADEITRSPVHTAAIGLTSSVPKDDPSKGLSIRFPRMKIWNRDKELPNTVSEILRMYELRKGKF
jgi:DNA ligase-1